jgi:hypothetical protein
MKKLATLMTGAGVLVLALAYSWLLFDVARGAVQLLARGDITEALLPAIIFGILLVVAGTILRTVRALGEEHEKTELD